MTPGQPWTHLNQGERIIFGQHGFVVTPCSDSSPFGWGRPLSTITQPASKTEFGTQAGGGFPQVFIPVKGVHDKFDYVIGLATSVEAGNAGISMGGKLVSWDSPYGCGILGVKPQHSFGTGSAGWTYPSGGVGGGVFVNAWPYIPEGELWKIQHSIGSYYNEEYQIIQSYKIYQGGKLLSWIPASYLGTPNWGGYTQAGISMSRSACKNFNLNGLGSAFNILAGYELGPDGISDDKVNEYDNGRGLDYYSNNYSTALSSFTPDYPYGYGTASTIVGDVDPAYVYKYRIGCAYRTQSVLIVILIGDESLKVLYQNPVGGSGWASAGTFDMTGGDSTVVFRGGCSDVQVTSDGLNFIGLASYLKTPSEFGVCVLRGSLAISSGVVALTGATTSFQKYARSGPEVADSNPTVPGVASQSFTSYGAVPIACGYDAYDNECFLTEEVTAYAYTQVNSNMQGWYGLLPTLSPAISGPWFTTGSGIYETDYDFLTNTVDTAETSSISYTLSKVVAGTSTILGSYSRSVSASRAWAAYEAANSSYSATCGHCKVLFTDFKNDAYLVQEGSIIETITDNVSAGTVTLSRSMSITDAFKLWVGSSVTTLYSVTQSPTFSNTAYAWAHEHVIFSESAFYTGNSGLSVVMSPCQEGIPWYDNSSMTATVSGTWTMPNANTFATRPKSYVAKNGNSYLVQLSLQAGLSLQSNTGLEGADGTQFIMPVFSGINYADFKIDITGGTAVITNNPVSGITGITGSNGRARAKHDCYRDQDVRGPCIKII